MNSERKKKKKKKRGPSDDIRFDNRERTRECYRRIVEKDDKRVERKGGVDKRYDVGFFGEILYLSLHSEVILRGYQGVTVPFQT